MSQVLENNAEFAEVVKYNRAASRRLRMTLLLSLVMGWATLVHALEQSGTIATYLAAETLAQMDTTH